MNNTQKIATLANKGLKTRVNKKEGAQVYNETSKKWEKIKDDNSHIQSKLFNQTIAIAKESIETYINEAKLKFTGHITDDMLVLYETKARIVKKIDEGLTFDQLSPLDQAIVNDEIAMKDEYKDFQPIDLINIWRGKAHVLYSVRSAIEAFQSNTLTALSTATTDSEVKAILASAKEKADAKEIEIKSKFGL